MGKRHEDGKYSNESLEGRRSSADVIELIADDNEDAIVAMSGFCARRVNPKEFQSGNENQHTLDKHALLRCTL